MLYFTAVVEEGWTYNAENKMIHPKQEGKLNLLIFLINSKYTLLKWHACAISYGKSAFPTFPGIVFMSS